MASEMPLRFVDRREAGRRLASKLTRHAAADPVVLALPRGGVPVGFEVAQALHAPLDVLLVRKLGAPGHEEFGIGAVVDGARPQTVLNAEAIEMLQVPPAYVAQESDRQLAEIERRRRLYSGAERPMSVTGRTVIIVDDGIATGATALVVLQALKRASPQLTVLAVPVAPRDTLAKLATEADEVVCLAAPEDFRAVSLHYADFAQTPDDEVIELLARRRSEVADERAHH